MLYSSCTRIRTGSTYLQLTLLFLLASGLGIAQTSPPRMQLHQYQEAIRVAEEKHLPQAQQGTLWAQLGSAYQNAADFAKAEEAYQHALGLLKNAPSSRPDYAETLDALASVYLYSDDLEAAEKARKQALAVREQLGDSTLIGASQVHLADIALKRHQFKKAEQLAMRGMDRMQISAEPPRVAMLSAYICLAFARCSRNHCDQGLMDAEHAVAFASKNFEEDSPAVAFALETLGFAQWKNGGAPNGEQPMLRGIELLKRMLAPGDPRLLGAMMQYRAYLLDANRPAEAQEMQKQVTSLRAQTGTYCARCTVSITSLASGLR